jgi:hypothetical protein
MQHLQQNKPLPLRSYPKALKISAAAKMHVISSAVAKKHVISLAVAKKARHLDRRCAASSHAAVERPLYFALVLLTTNTPAT